MMWWLEQEARRRGLEPPKAGPRWGGMTPAEWAEVEQRTQQAMEHVDGQVAQLGRRWADEARRAGRWRF